MTNLNNEIQVKRIVKKYLKLKLIIKDFSNHEFINKEDLNSYLKQIQKLFKDSLYTLTVFELINLSKYYNSVLEGAMEEVTEAESKLKDLNQSDNIFTIIDNLYKYKNLYNDYLNMIFIKSFYSGIITSINLIIDQKSTEFENEQIKKYSSK